MQAYLLTVWYPLFTKGTLQGNATGYEPNTMEFITFVVLVVLCGFLSQSLFSRALFSLHNSGSIAISPCSYLLFVGFVAHFYVMSIPCSFYVNWFATVNQLEHVSHLKYHWFRSHLSEDTIVIKDIESAKQKADGFTKPLTTDLFRAWRQMVCGW